MCLSKTFVVTFWTLASAPKEQDCGLNLAGSCAGGPLSRLSSLNAFALLAHLAANSPVGANGAVMLFAGEGTMAPGAKDLIFGLSLNHTRSDVYLAVQESRVHQKAGSRAAAKGHNAAAVEAQTSKST